MPHAVNPRPIGHPSRPPLAALIPAALILAALLAAGGCADEKSTAPLGAGDACRSCHTSKEALIASAAPVEEPSENPGEG